MGRNLRGYTYIILFIGLYHDSYFLLPEDGIKYEYIINYY